MTAADTSEPSPSTRRGRITRLLSASFGFAVALLFVAWEAQEQGQIYTSNSCNLRTATQSENPLIDPLHRAILRYSTPATSDRTVVVAIESSLETIQQNVCMARAFTSDLLQAIDKQGPSVIAVDRYYSDAACPADDPSTASLLSTVATLHTPLVVGAATHAPASENAASCLVLSAQLNLGARTRHGLTRLNQNVLLLPLRWPVLSDDQATTPAPSPAGDGFSLVTALIADPGLNSSRRLQNALNGPGQPYANVTGSLQRYTSTDLLCSTSPQAVTRWGLHCTGRPSIDLRSKVVVIGAESDSDRWNVLGSDVYGFELQARYVAALLSGSYLRAFAPWLLLLPLALYYAVQELLIPYMHIHHHPPRPLFHIEHNLLWTLAVFAGAIALGITVPLAFHRFPPIPFLVGALGLLIPRLLIESWVDFNERSEEVSHEGRQ